MNDVRTEIAVLVPCMNEAISIQKVIMDFQKVLPQSKIYVGDNNSTDATSEIARRLGCEVVFEFNPGKGNVVRKLIREVNADYFFIVDGDDTYSASAAPKMLYEMKKNNLDMVVATRKNTIESKKNERAGHLFGNRIINLIFNFLFKARYTDVLSGYRLLKSDFAKTFPSKSRGFEIEVELNAHASWMNASVMEIDSEYMSRNDGSKSKLRTFADGYRILKEIYLLSLRSKPIRHFNIFFTPLLVASFALILRATLPYLSSGIVENAPSLIVGMGLLVLYFVVWASFIVMEQSNSNQQTLVNLIQRLKPLNDQK
jgi:glycosyltransferase involved in cell wall biosynthesis